MNEQTNVIKKEAITEDCIKKLITILNDHIGELIKKTSVIVSHRPIDMLQALGAILILLAAFLKIQIQGVGFSSLTPYEFMTFTLSAASLLIVVCLIRLYQLKIWRDIIKEQQKLNADLIRQKLRVSAMTNK